MKLAHLCIVKREILQDQMNISSAFQSCDMEEFVSCGTEFMCDVMYD